MAYSRIPGWIRSKDEAHVTLGYVPGLGVSLRKSESMLRKEEDKLATQRRIAEAEQQQKSSAEESAAFQEKVVSWLPKVGIAIAVVVGGYFVIKALRKKG